MSFSNLERDMKLALSCVLAFSFLFATRVESSDSALRVFCDDDAAGAEVSINGKFKGECPLDVSVPEGLLKLSVVKKLDEEHQRSFNQDIRIGDGVLKRIDVRLGAVELTAEGLRLQAERQHLEAERQAEARRIAAERDAERRRQEAVREAERQRLAAELQRQEEIRMAEQRRVEMERQRQEQEAARSAQEERQRQLAERKRIQSEFNDKALAAFRARGITPGDGKTFKDCEDCPDMVLIPTGTFSMGSEHGSSSELPEHDVEISYLLAVGKTEITQAQWKAVMGDNPSNSKGDDLPVENVNWNDARELLNRLSSKTGYKYRLLSEAEWEYACRAGGRHEFCGSDDANATTWFDSNSKVLVKKGNWFSKDEFEGRTNPVAKKNANAWGMYDMSGNVWEWVEDCWNDNYSSAPTDGSAWTSSECTDRVLRGGSFLNTPRDSRSSNRYGVNATKRYYDVGFRPARIVSP